MRFHNLQNTIYDPIAWGDLWKGITSNQACQELLNALKALRRTPVRVARMAMCVNRLGDSKKALAMVAAYPDDPLCHMVRVVILASGRTPDDWRMVLADCHPLPLGGSVLHLESKQRIHFNRGICAVNLCDEQQAEQEFREAARIAENFSDVGTLQTITLERARLARLLGRYSESIEGYEQVLVANLHPRAAQHAAEGLVWCSYMTSGRLVSAAPAWAHRALKSLTTMRVPKLDEDLPFKGPYMAAMAMQRLRALYSWWFRNLSLLHTDERSKKLERLVQMVLACDPAGRDQTSQFFINICHGLALSIKGNAKGLADLLALLDKPIDHDPVLRMVYCAAVLQAHANLPNSPELLKFSAVTCLQELGSRLQELPFRQLIFIARWMRLFAPSALAKVADDLKLPQLKAEMNHVVRVSDSGAYMSGGRLIGFPVKLFNRWIFHFLKRDLQASGTELRQAYRIECLEPIKELSMVFDTVVHSMYVAS